MMQPMSGLSLMSSLLTCRPGLRPATIHIDARWWPLSRCVAERITANLSIMLASRGMCSPIATPGRLVLIGTNSPRTSSVASGFVSKVS